VLDDLLRAGLKLVVCGSAAGDRSAQLGQYYAGPGNKFWRTMARVGLTPRRLTPGEAGLLPDLGIGLTDLVKDQSGPDSGIEFGGESRELLRRKMQELQPDILCFNGKRAAKEFLRSTTVEYGLQPQRIGATRLFVAPSTSAAANGSWDPAWWDKLAALLRLTTSSGVDPLREPVKILETERLLMRCLLPSDLDDLYALYRDPVIRRYFPEGTLTRDETKEELEWFLNGHPDHPELGLWATIHKADDRFIGRCGLLPWTIGQHAEVEVAYLLAKEYWGQGLATEAARALVGYGVERLHLSRLICLILPGNQASLRVAASIGMTFEKELQDEHGSLLLYSMRPRPG
jgi:RimJ/RimL family protein N-acetyltransferase/G:T/U-mismatch repair DNA glycosylase